MTRFIALALLSALMLWPMAASAQMEPRLTVDMPEGDIIVGQPVILRLKLLVPTWMPKPPNWPNFEVPSLLVRLPERASTPVSETIEGETWSGISRAYRLYPLAVGAFDLPAQNVDITYADPDSTQPVQTSLPVPAIRFTATLPAAAKGLNPPLVAQGFSLTQQIDGGPDVQIGGAVQRIVTASIDGTTPILIPAMTGDLPATDALRAYPKEPVVTDTENRGVLSGTRTEAVTYVAQTDGSATLPEISVQWFNLDSGKVETARLDGMTLTITVPPPPPPGPADYAKWGAALIVGLAVIWLALRLLAPRVRRGWRRLKARWVASEPYAARQIHKALRRGTLGEIYRALDHWDDRAPGPSAADRLALDAALAQMGAARFGQNNPASDKKSRRQARDAFTVWRKSRRAAARRGRTSPGLAALNPTGQVSSGTVSTMPRD